MQPDPKFDHTELGDGETCTPMRVLRDLLTSCDPEQFVFVTARRRSEKDVPRPRRPSLRP
jgi:hypothetical protein